MEQPVVSKNARLTIAGQQHAGVFFVYADRAAWQPGQVASTAGVQGVLFALSAVTGRQRSKSLPSLQIKLSTGVAYVFVFDSIADREMVLNQLTLPAPAAAASAQQAALSHTGPPPRLPAAAAAAAQGRAGSAAAPVQTAQRGSAAGTTPAAFRAPSGGTAATSSAAGTATAGAVRSLAVSAHALAEAQGTIAGLSRKQREEYKQNAPEVQQLWSQLVDDGKGPLTEGEFWRGIKKRLEAMAGANGKPISVSGTAAAPAKRVGLSNLLTDPQSYYQTTGGAGGHNAAGGQHTARITDEQMALIFAEQPHVKKAYRQEVGSGRMSEEDFWRRYVKHRMHKEAKRKTAMQGKIHTEADASGVMFDVPSRQQSSILHGAASGLSTAGGGPTTRPAKRMRVDPAIDLAAQAGEEYMGHGLAHSSAKEAEVTEAGLDRLCLEGAPREAARRALAARSAVEELAAELNAHSAVVLRGIGEVEAGNPQGHPQGHPRGSSGGSNSSAAGTSPQAGRAGGGVSYEEADDGPPPARRLEALEDLVEPRQEVVEMLDIADPRRYFEHAQAEGNGEQTGAGAGAAAGGWQQQLQEQGDLTNGDASGMDASRVMSPMPGAGALVQLLGCMDPMQLPLPPITPATAKAALLAGTQDALRGGDGSFLGGGPNVEGDLQQMMRTQALVVAELCRHFWTSIPALSTGRRHKVEKLKPALQHQLQLVNAAMANSIGVQHTHTRKLLRPLRDMLDAALARYDTGVESAD